MSGILENPVTQADLEEWYRLQAELKRIKTSEMLLRVKIFKAYFPEPREGTNNFTLPDGHVLKGGHVVNREVDPGSFTALQPQFTAAGIMYNDLVKWAPTLKVAPYRTLTEEQRNLFDQCLIVKPGSPSLEIAPPSSRSKKT